MQHEWGRRGMCIVLKLVVCILLRVLGQIQVSV
jgi:hypothetical protein